MTHDSEQWGPWIEHDGSCMPVDRGTLGEAKLRSGSIAPFMAGCGSVIGGPDVPARSGTGSAWIWGSAGPLYRGQEVIAFRIRRPKALRELIARVENLPAPERERADT